MAITKVTTPDLINLPYNNTDGIVLPKGITSNIAASVSNCDYPTTGTALYQLDTNTNDTCGSNNGVNNNVTFNTSIKKYGTASAEFNGTNADIDLPGGINGTTMSVSFWMYIDATVSSDQVVFELQGTGGGSAGQDGYGVFFTVGGGGKLYMQTLNSNSNHTRSNVAIPASQWVHVVAVWNAGSRTFYIDTVAQTTGGTETTYLTMNGNTIGSRGSGEFFDGYIDQARIFSSALTQGQVTELYNETAVADNTGRPASAVDGEFRYNTTDKKVEYYDGSDWYQLSSSTIVPQSGTTGVCNYPTTATALYQLNSNGNDTCGNYNSTGDNSINYSAGKYGNAANFTSVSYITLPSDMFERQNANTLSMWIYLGNITDSDKILFYSYNSSNATRYYIAQEAAYITFRNSDNSSITNVSSALTATTWTHFAAVSDGSGGYTFYTNGTQSATGSFSNLTDLATLTRLGDGYTGSLDQVRFFPSALTATQVSALYTETAP